MDPIVGNKRLSSRVNHDENGDSGLFNGDFEKDGHEKYDNGNNGMEVDNPNRNDPMEESKQLAVDLDDLEHTMDSELAVEPVFLAPAKKRSSFSMLKKAIKSSITFGSNADGNEKCPLCLKAVFRVERIICSGASWHKSCFACGGTSDNGCRRILSKDYMIHHSNPFCRTCYTKVQTTIGGSENVNHNNPLFGYHGGDEVPMPVMASVSGGARAELPQLLKGVKVSERASNFDGHMRLGAPPVPINKCAKCDKTVYKAEEVFSSGGVWHKNCFTCGALSDVGCDRVLSRDNFLQHCGVPFCKACFGKYSKDPNFKGISPEFRKWAVRTKGEHLGGFEGGDFPEEMGQNLESGLVIENENILKIRKDEESDEYSDVDSERDGDEHIQKELECEVDGTEKEYRDSRRLSGNYDRSSKRLSMGRRHSLKPQLLPEEDPEPVDVITKILWSDADRRSATLEEKMGTSPFMRSGRNALTKLMHKTPEKKLRGDTNRLALTGFTEKPYDKNGVLYYIGTCCGTAPYKNPHLTNQVKASMSSVYKGAVHTLVEQVNGAMPNYSNNTKRSWMAIDLGGGRKLIPSRYCIRHGAAGKGNALRNWELRARERDSDGWTILRSHVNDDAISDEPLSAAAWTLFPPKGLDGTRRWAAIDGFRHFLILQTGPNSSNNDCLFVGGIELYGSLTEDDDFDV